MAHDWPTLTLKSAGVSLIDCDHRTPTATVEGYPYVAIPQLRNGRIELSDVRRISYQDFMDWTRKAKPVSFDVVVSRRCNPGETAFVQPGLDFAVGQNLVLLRADGQRVYPPFLRWLLRGPEWWEQVSKFLNVGAVFDSLRCADVPKFELCIPPIQDQRAIAHILGTLDEKIELNRRMNETLEAMARALFKSWFIDFDPVRAKAEGRDPGLPQHLADLFPDSLEESELGGIPKSWQTAPFTDTVEVLGGGTPKTSVKNYWNGEVPWFSVVDAPREEEVWVIDTEKRISSLGVENSAAQILPLGTTIISARGTVGRLALIGVPMAINQSCYGLRSRSGRSFLTYFATRSILGSLRQRTHGSVFDTITRSTLEGVRVAVSSTEVADAFERMVSPLMNAMREHIGESRTLASLRDCLLPRLLSGELRVGNAAMTVEATL